MNRNNNNNKPSRPPHYSNPSSAMQQVHRPPSSSSYDHQEYSDNSSNSISSFATSPGYYSDHPFMSGGSSIGGAGDASPFAMSPWHHAAASPYAGSPWNHTLNAASIGAGDDEDLFSRPGGAGAGVGCLIGSLIREEGHIYSLAATGELLYTGSDSKNIRVWKNQKEFAGFKSSSGLVKAIIIAGDKIFSGHQDGKIRVWRVSPKDPKVHKRVGSLPRLKDYIKCSLKPSNYVEVRRHRNALWIRHYDAISCLSLDQDHGLLYSGSWDKTFKVWRIADSKCLESVTAHDDAVNSVVAAGGSDGLVFTGSADGTVKVWRRELQQGKGSCRHSATQTLLKQESAVTALAVSPVAPVVYSGSSDGLINFWQWAEQQTTTTTGRAAPGPGRGRGDQHQLSHGGVLEGHKLAVLCLAAAGSLVMSGSADKTICVWRKEFGGGGHSCLTVLSGHGGPVKCLAVEEDRSSNKANNTNGNTNGGQRYIVYSGSLDKSVKMWRVAEQAP